MLIESLPHFRIARLRMGDERLTALLQESLAAATRLKRPSRPTSAVIVETTVQEKSITFLTDAKLMHRGERLSSWPGSTAFAYASPMRGSARSR